MAEGDYHLYVLTNTSEYTVCSLGKERDSEAYASWKGTHSWRAFREHQLVFAALGAIGLPTKYLAITRSPCKECSSTMPRWAGELNMDDFNDNLLFDNFGDQVVTRGMV